MALQNRVDPFGNLRPDTARGLFMGNRGGRFHGDDRALTKRRWASKQWICCQLKFNGRQREAWGASYTELFFLDEPTALAAGHRPCFECRRHDAERFALLFSGRGKRAAAGDIDIVLHRERLDGRIKRVRRAKIDELPDGACIDLGGTPFVLRGRRLLRWTPAGYDGARAIAGLPAVDVLTPPSILRVLKAGYAPAWHASAAC